MSNNNVEEVVEDESKSNTYPKVAPDPSMYLPRVRMTPLGPAPYWKMVTVPVVNQSTA